MVHLAVWCGLAAPALAQDEYNDNFLFEHYFGNDPHARNAALGRSGVALGGSTTGSVYNPATLGTIEAGDTVFSTSAPFYYLEQADFFFGGASYRVHPRWVTGISANALLYGPSGFGFEVFDEIYPIDRPFTLELSWSNAVEVLPGLHVGANATLFQWKYIDNLPPNVQFYPGVGLLYQLALPGLPEGASHELRIGASLNNATTWNIRYPVPGDRVSTQTLPARFLAGVVYEARLPITLPGAGSGPLSVLGTLEFQDVVNGPWRTGLKGGVELGLYDVLALRVGGYSVNKNDLGGNPALLPRVTDLTYGFGVKVPVDDLTEGRVPLGISLDYMALRQAPEGTRNPRFANLRTFTVGVAWEVPK